jgi:hypothetical protein
MLRRPIICAAIVLISCFAYGQKPPCTDAMSRRSEQEADSLTSWDALYRSYKLFGRCDDGSIAEGYSESVARILADHWDTVRRLAKLATWDAGFRSFVLRHIDATLDVKDVEKIAARTQNSCPQDLHLLCSDLKRRTDAAILELKTNN